MTELCGIAGFLKVKLRATSDYTKGTPLAEPYFLAPLSSTLIALRVKEG